MKWIIGIDEVGRGPLAGPITVGAVAICAGQEVCSFEEAIRLTDQKIFSGIKDSKKLSEKQRKKWKNIFSDHAIVYAISSVGPKTIDRIGIARSAKRAVAQCLRSLELQVKERKFSDRSIILLDGSLYAPPSFAMQQTIIKGDERVPVIAAASIIAKLHRDNIMIRLHRRYPQYCFYAHKGYGTPLHKDRILQYGLTPEHRSTFCTKML